MFVTYRFPYTLKSQIYTVVVKVLDEFRDYATNEFKLKVSVASQIKTQSKEAIELLLKSSDMMGGGLNGLSSMSQSVKNLLAPPDPNASALPEIEFFR